MFFNKVFNAGTTALETTTIDFTKQAEEGETKFDLQKLFDHIDNDPNETAPVLIVSFTDDFTPGEKKQVLEKCYNSYITAYTLYERTGNELEQHFSSSSNDRVPYNRFTAAPPVTISSTPEPIRCTVGSDPDYIPPVGNDA